MNTIRVLGFSMVVVVLLYAGCAKSTFKEGSQTAASIQKVEEEARVGKARVNKTIAALDTMFNEKQGDLKKQFKDYSKAIDNLEDQAKRVQDRVNTMTVKKSDYLQEWDNQMASIESNSIRQTAEQRRQNVENMFNNVQMEMDAAGKVYKPFISKLNDIRTAMNMDLNRNGLNAMMPIANQAKADAAVINGRLDAAIATLSDASKMLTK